MASNPTTKTTGSSSATWIAYPTGKSPTVVIQAIGAVTIRLIRETVVGTSELPTAKLTARKSRRDRRLQWIAIIAAFATGWIAIAVAALAIPLDKGRSIHCLIDPFGICI